MSGVTTVVRRDDLFSKTWSPNKGSFFYFYTPPIMKGRCYTMSKETECSFKEDRVFVN